MMDDFETVIIFGADTLCEACGIPIGAHDRILPVVLPSPSDEHQPTFWNASCLPTRMRVQIECRSNWAWN